jgi:thiamine biosynthesis lipoprotein
MRVRSRLFLLTFCIVILITSGCRRDNAASRYDTVEKTEFLMGTVVTIKVFDQDTDKGGRAAERALEKIRQIEGLMSLNIGGSEANIINEGAGDKAVRVSDDTLQVIQKGVYYGNLSGGLFDITVGPLVKLWGIGTEDAKIPETSRLEAALDLVDYKAVEIVDDAGEVFLKRPGMKIDLGGIAKGYAADEARKVLISEGIEHAIINLGGNVLTLGERFDGGPWNIGIKDPYEPSGSLLGVVRVEDKTVVTSGDYERYFEKDGRRYHHILNPFTGFPGENEIKGATIITGSSTDADALSTMVFLMGTRRGMELLESLEGVQAIIVTRDKQVFVTQGLEDEFGLQKKDYSLRQVGSE